MTALFIVKKPIFFQTDDCGFGQLSPMGKRTDDGILAGSLDRTHHPNDSFNGSPRKHCSEQKPLEEKQKRPKVCAGLLNSFTAVPPFTKLSRMFSGASQNGLYLKLKS